MILAAQISSAELTRFTQDTVGEKRCVVGLQSWSVKVKFTFDLLTVG
jgi:hypothetical protein